ncbi:uncharacterized protein LOC6732307 [Drosophila simulans]|uniref:GD22018 n=1 Tax=Drosophila simulans TaxID=7240 RepID=B4Q5H6_DROSI|nr:uncharacterized protein LOC6732307 [Drosophila simulans]EDX05020.1 GD22018 [Drosophila simulans]KMY90221.1 uncharacterized protein Dsimw501_GD22018 [Drosophila simulans]
MQYSYLLAICVSLLLLKLEGAAASSLSTEPTLELLNVARQIGLDEVGLREMWNSRQPLVIRNQNDAGQVTTVTYELSPDLRSISRRKVSEGVLPARLEDNSGSKPQQDWEYVPSAGRQFRPIGESNFGTGNFDTNIFSSEFPRFPNWELPAGVTPKVTTKTETDSLGRKVTTTTRTYSGTLVPGSNVFKQIFPDISREPGPINTDSSHPAENPDTAAFSPSRTGPIDFNYVYDSRPCQKEPAFVPVIDSTTTQRTSVPLPTLAIPKDDGSDRVIDDYLKEVDLTASEIENSNGEVVKTIVDKNGRILTARFVLSSVKGTGEGSQQQRPTK